MFHPTQTAVLQALDQLHTANRAAFIRHQADLAVVHRAAERDRWQRLALVLALSISIAIIATVHASLSETRLIAQLAKHALNTRALQNLSTKLINAQEEERGRIAPELHDDLGQVLTAVRLELGVAQRQMHTAGASENLLEAAQLITGRALHKVRDLAYVLHPAALDDFGLAVAVDSYLRDWSKRSGVRADLRQIDMEGRLSSDIEVAAYRIIQEALTNVAKHAHASICHVGLQRDCEKVTITIEDDGRGFDVSEPMESRLECLGLLGIRQRVSQLGGSAVVSSIVGQGTTVRIEFPARWQDEHVVRDTAGGAPPRLRTESAHG